MRVSAHEHVQMNQNEKVSLGCGTLILIALIVMIFGNMGKDRYEPEFQALQQSVQELQSQMESLETNLNHQTELLESLRQEIRDLSSQTNN